MSAETLTFIRKWRPSTDCVAVESGDKKLRGIYLHTWATGSQELVFDTPQDAADWARGQGADLTARVWA